MTLANLLVVDDDSRIRSALSAIFSGVGYGVREAADCDGALRACSAEIDLVLLDYRLPDGDGVGLIPRLKEVHPDVLVLLLTGHASVDTAVQAMRQGAYDYLEKPCDEDLVLSAVGKALETTQLRRQLRRLHQEQAQQFGITTIIGESSSMLHAKEVIARVAHSRGSTVLLSGESGTGKDLAAKVIHYNSDRVAAPFMTITCSALPEPLLESELFGHERGAFTDAKRQKKGLLELADGGTVFLDEIGEMPALLQAKLLRFLEERAFKRVGGDRDIQVDVRIIAATNRVLADEVHGGRFREDLFYRLNVLPIELPPLRRRAGDVPLLAAHFVTRFNGEFRTRVGSLSPAASALLDGHGWPGNIRELRNIIERAMLLAGSRTRLEREDFASLRPERRSRSLFALPAEGIDLEAVERSLVAQALERTGWNQTRAAELLGIHRDQVRYRIRKFSLAPRERASAADAGAASS